LVPETDNDVYLNSERVADKERTEDGVRAVTALSEYQELMNGSMQLHHSRYSGYGRIRSRYERCK
jgi:hypothetical protein